MRPRLAVFPKCFMDQLCVDHTMTVCEWIELAAALDVDGLEFYSGFLRDDQSFLNEIKYALARHELAMPMLCCSPDFTQPDAILLQGEIEREKRMIELTAFFGGRYCRVLSGQRRPGLDRERGVARVVGAIRSLLPFAEEHGIVLTMENHYKDNYWQYGPDWPAAVATQRPIRRGSAQPRCRPPARRRAWRSRATAGPPQRGQCGLRRHRPAPRPAQPPSRPPPARPRRSGAGWSAATAPDACSAG